MLWESGDGMCGIQRSGGGGVPSCVAGHTPPVGSRDTKNLLSDSSFAESLTSGKHLGIIQSLRKTAQVY